MRIADGGAVAHAHGARRVGCTCVCSAWYQPAIGAGKRSCSMLHRRHDAHRNAARVHHAVPHVIEQHKTLAGHCGMMPPFAVFLPFR
ncbi:hypothetical protein FHR51_000775 [Xanthomonas arboricola]|uniref:hypothetical protein n=1 Tax=Xanthomonas cannabis TaxID=1885674 RepID=UPI0016202CB2|nr:hypothetical protein [Xanthomonas cannabis]MBB3804664.1 hypothetical protein [Xanthomonas cannabis]